MKQRTADQINNELNAVNIVVDNCKENIGRENDKLVEWVDMKKQLEAELETLKSKPLNIEINGFPVELYIEKYDRYIILIQNEIVYDADHVYSSDWGDFQLTKDQVDSIHRQHTSEHHFTGSELSAFFGACCTGEFDSHIEVLKMQGFIN